MAPPATPTAGRDYFNADGGVTPVNGSTTEVDEGLMSRFEKVEEIGKGEFSVVYRVTQPQNRLSATQSFYFGASGSPLQSGSPRSPLPARVFAVKKARQPYQGAKDRQRKLQEVNVLKALGQCDHVVHFIDSWERDDYLYIQTEYCEEGSLDSFLLNVGRKGRLDDFRIWKIMLELGQVSRSLYRLISHADFNRA
jgi:mitosis inhibitor protein kinase SWE1